MRPLFYFLENSKSPIKNDRVFKGIGLKMHDIRQIRQDSSDFDRQMKRGLTPNSADILSMIRKEKCCD